MPSHADFRPMSRALHVGVALLVAVGGAVLGAVVAIPVAALLSVAGGLAAFAGLVVASEAGYAVAGYAFLRTGDAADLAPSWVAPGVRGLWLVVAGTLLTVGFNRLAFGLAASVGIDPVAAVAPPERLAVWPTMLVLAPVFVLVVGPVEEYLFRGVLQRYLLGAFSMRGAIAWSSLLFVLVHLPTVLQVAPGAVVVTGPVLFVVSVCFGWLYERTGTLVVPALVHGFYDVAVFWFLLSQWGVS